MTTLVQKFPLGLKFVFILCMFWFNMVLAYFLATMLIKPLFGIEQMDILVSSVPKTAQEVNAVLFLQGLIPLGGFLITAIMFAKLETGSARERLLLNVMAPAKMFLLAFFAVVTAQFFTEFFVTINSKIPLPPGLAFLRDTQKQTEDLTNALLNFKSTRQFLFVSVVLAVIPALAEEFFFRGLLLGQLLRGKINPWLSIYLTGLAFAISHFEFDNTLAILILGMFLGYLYYVSGSIWLPVAVHFTNNFLAVLLKYLFNIGLISKEIAGATTPVYVSLAAMLIFAGCIYIFNKWKQPAIYLDDEPHLAEPHDWTR